MTITEALIAAGGILSTATSALVASWVARRNAHETARIAAEMNATTKETSTATLQEKALQTLLEGLQKRQQELGDRVTRLEADNERLLDKLAAKETELLEERAKKHDAANEAHAAQLKYEHDMGEVKEQHARELGEMRARYEKEIAELQEKCKSLSERLSRMERKLGDATRAEPPPAPDATG